MTIDPRIAHSDVRDHDNERGATLVELLIAMMIMGTAVVAIVAGMSTAIIVSAQNREQTQAAVAVRSYAEVIAGSYKACAPSPTDGVVAPGPNPYFRSRETLGLSAGFEPSVVAVQYLTWDSATKRYKLGAKGATCDEATDAHLQQVSLRVTGLKWNTSADIAVMLRKPCLQDECKAPTP